MKQAVLRAPERMEIRDVEVPALQQGDLLLRVESSLVCGTDVRIHRGLKKRNVSFPTVMGHEFAATVAESNGPLPDGLGPGDQVAVYPLLPCGACVACRKGHENICRERVAFGYQLPGGFSQFVRVPERAVQNGNVVPVPGVSAAEAAIVEPVACAYNGQELARTRGAETMLVSGCGPLGLIHIRLARLLGVARIAAVDPVPERRTAALESGASLAVAPGEEAAERIKEWTAGAGVDVVIAAVGRTDAIQPYLRCLAPGARISVFAGFREGAQLEIPANDIHYNEWTLVGASSCRLDGFRTVAGMVARGELRVDDLLGTQLPLDDVVKAIDLAATGQDMRVGISLWA